MNVRLVGSCGVLALCLNAAATAGSQPGVPTFELNSVEVGGIMGADGMPIIPSFGDYFQHQSGDNYPPDPDDFDSFPSLEFDSYIAISGQGPSSANNMGEGAPEASFPMPFDNANGHFDIANQLRGGWLGDSPSKTSDINPNSGLPGVFIARLTMLQNAVPQSEAIVLNIEGEDTRTLPLTLAGQQPPIPRGGRVFQITGYRTGSGMNLSPATTGDTVLWDTWDIWVEEVPTPGALTLFGAAGLMGARRRRRNA